MKKTSMIIGFLAVLLFAVAAGAAYVFYDVAKVKHENDDLVRRNEKVVEEREGLLDQIRVISERPKAEVKGEYDSLKLKNELLEKEKENLLARITKLSEITEEDTGSDDVGELRRVNTALKRDRDNILIQTKILMSERSVATGIIEKMGETDKKIAVLEEDRGELEARNASLLEAIRELEFQSEEIATERDTAVSSYERVTSGGAIKDLKTESSQLKKEQKTLKKEVKKLQKLLEKNAQKKEKLEVEKNKLKHAIGGYKEQYKHAVKTNREMERQMRDMPKKFTEMAKENEKLIKQTAKTHYNLGVFYVSNKEFKRAAMEFEKALELEPGEAYTHFNLGYIYSEHVLDRKKAIKHFKTFLHLTKGDDPDIDWVRKYVLTWESFEGDAPIR